jgi:hypothetical protein
MFLIGWTFQLKNLMGILFCVFALNLFTIQNQISLIYKKIIKKLGLYVEIRLKLPWNQNLINTNICQIELLKNWEIFCRK